MPDDRDDDDTPPAGSKSSRGPKKRFQDRDHRDDEDDDDRPAKKRRVIADDGPRVKTNDNIPVIMLLAFIGSAVSLLVICAGLGWWSFDWLVLGNSGGGGGGGEKDFEVTSASRQPGFRLTDPPTVAYTVRANQKPTAGGLYYLVMKSGSQSVAEPIHPSEKGWGQTVTNKSVPGLRGASGKLELWIEKRQNPVTNGKVVSNVYVVP